MIQFQQKLQSLHKILKKYLKEQKETETLQVKREKEMEIIINRAWIHAL